MKHNDDLSYAILASLCMQDPGIYLVRDKVGASYYYYCTLSTTAVTTLMYYYCTVKGSCGYLASEKVGAGTFPSTTAATTQTITVYCAEFW